MGSVHMAEPNFSSIFEPLSVPPPYTSSAFLPSFGGSSPSYCPLAESRDSSNSIDVMPGLWDSSNSIDVMPGLLCSPPCRSLSLGSGINGDKKDADDGSVACKLLSSITKSLSSPSLLSCCKESARETPYQKSLRLRTMKLQHCAEELGSESSASMYGDDGGFATKSLTRRSSESEGCFASALLPERDRVAQSSSAMVSVRSAPNLGCPSLASRHRERSFPPPLAHTLPRSLSADSFTFELRACREDGRLMLKEVKVPCRQYLRASRKDGRLTLRLFTADESNEADNGGHYGQLADATDSEEDGSNLVSETDKTTAGSCCQYGDVEKEASNDVGGEEKEQLDECSLLNLRKTEISSDGLGIVNYFREKSCLSAKCLLLPAFNAGDDDQATCSDAVRTKINYARHHIPKNQPSATKIRASLTSASTIRCSTLCSNQYSPSFKVTPLLRLIHGEEEKIANQSRSSRRASIATTSKSLGLEISSAFRAGLCGDRSASPTMILNDAALNSVMKEVAKLVDSFGSEGAKWCQKKIVSREVDRKGSLTTKRCHHRDEETATATDNGIRSINIGVKKLHIDSRKETCKFQVLNLVRNHELRHISALEEESRKLIHGVPNVMSTATIHLDVQSPLHLEWLHGSHCKELLDRDLVSKGFPCVAIRT